MTSRRSPLLGAGHDGVDQSVAGSGLCLCQGTPAPRRWRRLASSPRKSSPAVISKRRSATPVGVDQRPFDLVVLQVGAGGPQPPAEIGRCVAHFRQNPQRRWCRRIDCAWPVRRAARRGRCLVRPKPARKRPELLCQFGGVDADAATFGHIRQVQRDDQRQAEFCELGDEKQIASEVGGIDDGQYGARSWQISDVPQQHVDGDHLVRGLGGEGIGAGQIHQRHILPVQRDMAGVLLDRNAGIVRRFLAQARQGIEEGALAGIRVADQGDDGCGPRADASVMSRE